MNKSIIFGLFAIIVCVVFLNLTDGAFEVQASLNDHQDSQHQLIEELFEK